MISNSQDIFHQLAGIDGTVGVRVTVENHDAWLHNHDADAALANTLCLAAARASRNPQLAARIERQRRNLQSLVTRIRTRVSSAS